MTKFIWRLIKFCSLLLTVTLLGMLTPRITPHQNLYYALIDKHQQLEEIDSPRIVVVGGSNLSFGIDSRMLKQTFNKPVINTSIHAGLGLKFIIEDLIPYIKEGDIVVLAPEYDHFYGDALWGYEPMVSSIFAIPSNYRLFNMHNWKEMLSAVPKEALKNIAKYFLNVYRSLIGTDSPGIYDRDSFNSYGDVTTHYNEPKKEFSSNDISGDYNPEAIEVINNFRQLIESKGGRLLITYPCLNKASFDLYPDKISNVEKEFEKNRYTILGSPERYCFNDSLYFNGKYHLTKQGVEKRTSLLINDLKNIILQQQ